MEADDDPYLQIDLGKQKVITAVATQGLNNPQGNWVERYSLNYSCDGINWKTYQSFAKDEVNTIPLNKYTSYELFWLKVRLNQLNVAPIDVNYFKRAWASQIGNRNKWG